MSVFTIRPATAADAEAIHGFIYELAVYEREPDAVEGRLELAAGAAAACSRAGR